MFVSCKKDKQYTITVNSNDTTMGTVTGGGTYAANATATLTATANDGYTFVKWQDGNTTNPRTITVTKDETYTATFEAIPAGVYVTMGSESWQAGEFMVDADIFASFGLLYAFIFKTTSTAGYPQFQGYIPSTVGTATQADDNVLMLYVGSASEIDAEGHVQWSSQDLQTNVTAIDLNTMTISATQSGQMLNSTTSETKDLNIKYVNVTWTPASVAKSALLKF